MARRPLRAAARALAGRRVVGRAAAVRRRVLSTGMAVSRKGAATAREVRQVAVGAAREAARAMKATGAAIESALPHGETEEE
ncbi:MAG: hypothetical protein FJ149_08815 [Euryarchaeota archaeon]|nr:hypothetical protein [Euryarchaeota archaeon]